MPRWHIPSCDRRFLDKELDDNNQHYLIEENETDVNDEEGEISIES